MPTQEDYTAGAGGTAEVSRATNYQRGREDTG